MRSDPVSPSIVRSVRAQDGEELNPWGDGIHVMLGPRLDGLTEVVQVVHNLRYEELCRVTSLKTVWAPVPKSSFLANAASVARSNLRTSPSIA